MHAMLSLDLDGKTTSEQREKFYAHIEGSRWMKVAKVTTTWCTSFKGSTTESEIVAEAKRDVAAAAIYSDITAYDAVVNVSQSKPSSF